MRSFLFSKNDHPEHILKEIVKTQISDRFKDESATSPYWRRQLTSETAICFFFAPSRLGVLMAAGMLPCGRVLFHVEGAVYFC